MFSQWCHFKLIEKWLLKTLLPPHSFPFVISFNQIWVFFIHFLYEPFLEWYQNLLKWFLFVSISLNSSNLPIEQPGHPSSIISFVIFQFMLHVEFQEIFFFENLSLHFVRFNYEKIKLRKKRRFDWIWSQLTSNMTQKWRQNDLFHDVVNCIWLKESDYSIKVWLY